MSSVAISAPNLLAAEAGVSLARSGGNAVDAAIATAVVAATTEPGLTSLGGAAYVTVSPPGGARPVTVDGGVAMPGLGAGNRSSAHLDLRQITLTYGGRRLNGYFGWGSAATPGCIAALYRAHELYCTKSWANVLGPATEIAASGFPLGASASMYLDESADRVFAADEEIASVVLDVDGRAVKRGSILRIPHLPEFLARLAREGPSAFYEGATARQLASAMKANGGLVTRKDLASYEPALRESAARRFNSWRLFTNPSPALGGVRLLSLLHQLEATWVRQSEQRQLEAMVDALVQIENSSQAGLATARAMQEAPSTVHISAVDSAGLACAITVSSGYGAGIAAPLTGIWLGNSLGESELNRAGMHQRRPGARIPSNMAPSVARNESGTIIAIGTPGAERIISALGLVLASIFFDSYSVAQAVRRPRIHITPRELPDDRLTLEVEAPLEIPVEAETADLAYRAHPTCSMYFGAVTAAVLYAGGRLEAIADRRRQGSEITAL